MFCHFNRVAHEGESTLTDFSPPAADFTLEDKSSTLLARARLIDGVGCCRGELVVLKMLASASAIIKYLLSKTPSRSGRRTKMPPRFTRTLTRYASTTVLVFRLMPRRPAKLAE